MPRPCSVYISKVSSFQVWILIQMRPWTSVLNVLAGYTVLRTITSVLAKKVSTFKPLLYDSVTSNKLKLFR